MKFNKMKKFFLVFLFYIFLTTTVLAQDVNKVGDWWGKVTINSVENDNGAVIDAYINNVKVSSTTVGQYTQKYYLIHIEGESGNQILFKVNNVDATTVYWSKGDHNLNLAVTYSTNSDDEGTTTSTGGGGGGTKNFLSSIRKLITNDDEEETEDSPKKQEKETDEIPKEQSSFNSFLNAAVIGVSDFVKTPAGVATFVIVGLMAVGGVTFLAVKGKFKRFLPKKKEEITTEQ